MKKEINIMDVQTAIKLVQKKEKIGAVYKITNTQTNKNYIGSSKNVYNRFYQHIKSLFKNKHHSPHLQHSWNKYGPNCFVFEIIEIIDKNNFKDDKEYMKILRSREQYYIDYYLACNPKHGYNINKKAEGGRNLYTVEDLKSGKCPFTEDQFFYIMEGLQNPYTNITKLAKELNIKPHIIYNITNDAYPLLTQDYYIPKRMFHNESEIDEELRTISEEFRDEI